MGTPARLPHNPAQNLPLVPYRREPRFRLPAWELRLICEMYHDGITVREIAEAARVSPATVYRILAQVRAAQYGVSWVIGETSR